MSPDDRPVPRIALTLGEPAGIGPDICLKLAQRTLPGEVVVIGDPDLLKQRAKQLKLSIVLHEFNTSSKAQANGNGCLTIVPIKLSEPCVAGQLNVANSEYVLQTLRQAYQICSQDACKTLVTGPVHKAIINQSGTRFLGHTEFFAHLAEVEEVLMTFYTPDLILGLTTTHCPLNKVSTLITQTRLKRALELLHDGLKHLYRKPRAKISVCGLNPHAGENGLLGNEEQVVIIPVIEELKAQGMNIEGPLPADTAFCANKREQTDAILAMYHDQGLAPLKALYFNQIVNVTLGLPFIRASVDHGTALDLAGTGKADPASLYKALTFAANFTYQNQHEW